MSQIGLFFIEPEEVSNVRIIKAALEHIKYKKIEPSRYEVWMDNKCYGAVHKQGCKWHVIGLINGGYYDKRDIAAEDLVRMRQLKETGNSYNWFLADYIP